MKHFGFAFTGVVFLLVTFCTMGWSAEDVAEPVPLDTRKPIHALYIPLADHYAGILAYDTYRDEMKHAKYTIEQMKSWRLLRAKFLSGEVDMAFVMGPLAMDMFRESPEFRWVGLVHRDGNAMAINGLIRDKMSGALPELRIDRKPGKAVADALQQSKVDTGKPVECGVPSLLATHTVVLYKYLKEHGMTLGIGEGTDKDVVAIAVPPPKAPSFLKKNNTRQIPSAFEQSLPWADVVETGGFGHVAWYSKDVMPWPNGHVECIILASDKAIAEKPEAVREVIHYIHQAGQDIEQARLAGGVALEEIADIVHDGYIKAHEVAAIVQSLRLDLGVINYRHLNVDKKGLRQIMDLAVEGGILQKPVDIDVFADMSFSTTITDE